MKQILIRWLLFVAIVFAICWGWNHSNLWYGQAVAWSIGCKYSHFV